MATDVVKQEEGLTLHTPQLSTSPCSTKSSLPASNATTPTKDMKMETKPGQSASRRPPRKSTLTQQQKNQKRQRATQDQLTTLEIEFNKNPTPTATVRERIAEEINMTERSVQIWFQNRRAKIKMLAKKSLESGEELDTMIPESMRQYLAMQAMESGKSIPGFFGRPGPFPYGHQGMMGAEQGGQGKVLIHHLNCRSLTIGRWTRVGQNAMDLIVFYSPDKCTMTYYINNEQAGYKIEYPFSYIKNIYLNNSDDHHAGITIELLEAPFFYMDSATTSTFIQVNDFTEDLQASRCMTHHLGGNPKALSGQLAKLVSLESFMHRHTAPPPPPPMFDQLHTLSMSAPVSPQARPSSQPNFAQPHVGMFQETQWGIAAQHHTMMMRGPGHKRQRSRSVPGPIDFQTMQLLQNPPSFHITQPEGQPHTQNPHIFSPIPQQPNMLGPIGPNLRIDTRAGFGSLDMRQYPLSATTAPSPSEFSSPNYFASQAPEPNGLPAGSFTPYSGTFSPMVNPASLGVPPPSISPLSFNHPDPAIVGESPPMSMPPMCDGSAISDDGSMNDMYPGNKHTMTLPLHPHSPFMEQSQSEIELNQYMDLKHYDVDPASLSPESVQAQ
ncbi:Transcription elongation factor SPT4 [Podospora pseudopauciseta]|uniref:Transcription elongation factor SPT4 n=2 Tax=Podospora TaxID=5144 RepID=A0ABR0HQ10_9PEZI|nr:Transcription elongation factor SPT4 [Podospora bellae-mahoneyi]KAK4669833.1 Transcription elongation factor SPT4 [Podospora pseudopauciseta]